MTLHFRASEICILKSTTNNKARYKTIKQIHKFTS